MIGRMLVALILAALAACAPQGGGPGGAAPMPAAPPPGMAAIHLYRPYTFAGSANLWDVSVNNVDIASMKAGSQFVHTVPPGPVSVHVKVAPNLLNVGVGLLLMPSPTLSFDAVAGEVHYLELSTHGLTGGPQIGRAPPDRARAAIARLSPAASARETAPFGELLVKAPPIAPARGMAGEARLALGEITDARPVRDRIGQRSAAFGVRMGPVALDRPVGDYMGDVVRAALGDALGAEQAPGRVVDAAVRTFWVDTDTSPISWNVKAAITVDLSVRDASGAVRQAACAASERTYVWPDEAIFAKVIAQCIGKLRQKIVAALAGAEPVAGGG